MSRPGMSSLYLWFRRLQWLFRSAGFILFIEVAGSGLIAAGKLVPDAIVVRLLKDAMEQTIRTTGKRNFLFDGFPRSQSNLDAWYEVFGKGSALPDMLYFECPFEVLEQRILGRAR